MSSRSIGLKAGGRVLVVLFIIAIPLLLVTVSVTWAVNDLRLYRHGFDKYHISGVTGIEEDGLMAVARQIKGYFNSTREPLEIRAEIFGEERELFNEREVLHMRDVKRLIWGVYGVEAAAAVYILGFVGVGFFARRRLFAPALSRHTLWGSGLTLGLIVLVGLIALVGVRFPLPALSPGELRQRLLDAGPQEGLSGDVVPPGVLVRRDPFRGTGNRGAGRGAGWGVGGLACPPAPAHAQGPETPLAASRGPPLSVGPGFPIAQSPEGGLDAQDKVSRP